ncbi:hypothetical protein Q8F55_005253 [Vanrija albida]|uniref:Lysosomal dipeptide transporter MFSD1 n=1 Tax=Vanrija albida TaxID=181172 RepID=A0ABR3Q194_9TREE
MASPIRSSLREDHDETSSLLSNECSTPIRKPSPPGNRLSRQAGAGHALDSPSASNAHLTPQQVVSRRMSQARLLRSRSLVTLNDPDSDRQLTRSRLFALLAVCTLSIGSHFTMYLLGPLKTRLHKELGTSNSQFSLLVSALNLNSTWMPLVGGILVSRFGTTWSSVACTGSVLFGALVLFQGVLHFSIVTMAFGLFLFGLGMTPLMVVQETLIARLSPGGHLGLSLALGLVSGKTASFISALVSLPLAELGGDKAPFLVALLLCAGSFVANLARLGFGWGAEKTSDVGPHAKRIVKWDGLSRLGDVFWLYILLNLFCGAIWQPFLHLSANLVQVRYGLTEQQASFNASVLLGGAIILYPIVGWITDHYGPNTPRTTFLLFLGTSVLTLFCYVWLSLPVSFTHSPWPGMIAWALGHGASTLLLVVLIPRILPAELVPLGLGLHKALEVCASTLCQTLSGLWLDWAKEHRGGQESAVHSLLVIYAAINVVQFVLAYALWRFERARRHACGRRHAAIVASEEYERLPMYGDEGSPDSALADDDDDDDVSDYGSDGSERKEHDADDAGPQSGLARNDAEKARGKVFFMLGLVLIAVVWIVWIVTAWRKLR